MPPYSRDPRDSSSVRDTDPEPNRPAVDVMLGQTCENLRQLRTALNVLMSRIEPRPTSINPGKEVGKEPSLMELAEMARELSAVCAKLTEEMDGMLFQSSRGKSAQMVG